MFRFVNKIFFSLLALFLLAPGAVIWADTIEEIDRSAQRYFEQREYQSAISEWMRILEVDPNNEYAQRKIEMVYEEKHKKDVAYQRARIHYKIAKKELKDNNIDSSIVNAKKAISNFVEAYRINPNDPELQAMKDEMKQLDDRIKIEERKKRLSEEMRKQYILLLKQAKQKMELEQFNEALEIWEQMLEIVPLDKTAKAGRRKAELAINNRLKYENIKRLLASGVGYFKSKKYKEARLEFEEVLRIDPGNDDAEEYVDEIKDILDEEKNFELKRFQAEQFYVSGLQNLKSENFDRAKNDFESVLALIENYKDTAERLKSIDRLRDVYKKRIERNRLKEIDEKFQNGLVALSAGKYEEAIAEFESTLKLDPKNKLAKEYIKSAKDALKQKEEEIVDINSPYYSIINSLIVSGRVLFEKGDFTASRERWIKILNIFPKNRVANEYRLKCDLRLNPGAYRKLIEKIVDEGRQYLKNKDYGRALREFQLVKSISPAYPGLDRLIATATEGKEGGAETGASKAEVERRYQMGINFYRKGGKENLEKALVFFRWIVAKDPKNIKAAINYNRIQAQLRIGSGEEARGGDRLSDKQKQLVRMYYYQGINFYSNNNYSRAIQSWRRVLAIDPYNQKAKNNIRKCLVLLRR